jgi:hypothetical protein
MKPESAVTDRFLDVIARAPGCRIEDLADLFPSLTLQQVYLTLGYLASKGQLRLMVDGQGSFAVVRTLRSFN